MHEHRDLFYSARVRYNKGCTGKREPPCLRNMSYPPRSYDFQVDYDIESSESTPTSPTSSDTSAGSWSNMSQVSRGPSATRHPDYYIDSGDVIFLADSQLFKAHRHFFVRESDKFRDVLCKPAPTGSALMGSSDLCPIELHEVSAREFTRFLWVFYNPNYSYDASVEKWSSILRLAHLWKFPKVKELAVREMDRLDIAPVDKAVMAREYEVDPARRWLDTAYAALGARDSPLTKNEGLRLGLDVVLHLAEVRERIRERRRTAAAARGPTPPPPVASQQLAPNDLFGPPSPRAPPSGSWRSWKPEPAVLSRAESPASIHVSERAPSVYAPSYRSASPTRSDRSISPPAPFSRPRSTHSQLACITRADSYTEDDVADVRAVFPVLPVQPSV
ncbi:hypothetical protein DFH11DRAFT_1587378 [Phellopilus nigrolimitatus]|nr:hypothetical protein DFH11DRAFT_1587378 [Phellopilus nigrolimitatus]